MSVELSRMIVEQESKLDVSSPPPSTDIVSTSVDALFGSPRGRVRPKSLEFRSMRASFDAEIGLNFSGSLSG